jgi:hypothetical protein
MQIYRDLEAEVIAECRLQEFTQQSSAIEYMT